MSEVYIRSQNKEKLYRLGGNYACVEYGEYVLPFLKIFYM